jgi:hypothetical protein
MATRRPNAGLLKVEPSEGHKALAEFIEKTTGHTVPVGEVALVQRAYPLYLKSPSVVKAREAEAAAKAKAAEDKEKAKQDRLRARLEAIEAQRAKLLRDLGIETDDETGPTALSVVADEPEGATLTLGDDSPVAEDEFIDLTPDADEGDDDWGDDNDEEDF